MLKGEQALAYVRARYGIGDGSDLGRIQRQQRFLGAMVRSATSTKLLVNPVALTKFLGAATKSLTLDRDTSFGDLKELADQLHGLDPKRVSFLTAPIANPAYTPPGFPAPPPGQGGSRVLLDDVAGRALYDSIINDKPQAPKAAKPTGSPKPNVLTVAPQEVKVRVLNGVGVERPRPQGVGRPAERRLHHGRADERAGDRGDDRPVLGPDNRDARSDARCRGARGGAAAGREHVLDLVVGSNYTGGQDGEGRRSRPPPRRPPRRSRRRPPPPAVTAADARCG